MDIKTLLQRGYSEISDDPLDRVSEDVKNIIELDDFSIDCHAHLMNKNNLTSSYLLLRFLSGIIPARSHWDEVIDWLVDHERDNDIDLIIELLNKPGMKEVAELYFEDYTAKQNTIITALMLDLQYGLPVHPEQTFSSQVEELNCLGKDMPLLPFLGLDPHRCQELGAEHLYPLFLKAFGEMGHFTGVKCYPSMGYLPSDPALMPIFELCQAKSIPVTAHCGGVTVSSVHRRISLSGRAYSRAWKAHSRGSAWSDWEGKRIGRSRVKKAEFLNHPLHWLPVLQAFPDLKLNLAHIGGNDHWRSYQSRGRSTLLDHFSSIMEQYPFVYGDFSGLPLEEDLFSHFLENSDFEILRKRALYGTDYWVNLSWGTLKESITTYKKTPPHWRTLFERDNPRSFLFSKI